MAPERALGNPEAVQDSAWSWRCGLRFLLVYKKPLWDWRMPPSRDLVFKDDLSLVNLYKLDPSLVCCVVHTCPARSQLWRGVLHTCSTLVPRPSTPLAACGRSKRCAVEETLTTHTHVFSLQSSEWLQRS